MSSNGQWQVGRANVPVALPGGNDRGDRRGRAVTDLVDTEIAVIGAGPAGIAAAVAASCSSRSVVVVDDNPDVGGQIWRGEQGQPLTSEAAEWLQRAAKASHVQWMRESAVVGADHSKELLVYHVTANRLWRLRFQRLILATGARELFLPLPGWTLPGVFGAGGLQALVKGGWSVMNKRIAVVGSGPLLLAVAAYLQQCGANLVVVAEQAPWRRVSRYAMHLLLTQFTKFRRGVRLRRSLSGTPYRVGCWPVRIIGTDRVEGVVLTDGIRQLREKCDFVACGFGLIPNVELAALLGCHVRDGRLCVDGRQESSVAGVFGAGEVCGIAGVDSALLEGQIAGYHASGADRLARSLYRRRDRLRRYAQRLEQAFALRDELRRLPEPDTIVCRCEDVVFDAVRDLGSNRAARLYRRCGMGACQGRVCGPALRFLFGWQDCSVRPPLFPVPLGVLSNESR